MKLTQAFGKSSIVIDGAKDSVKTSYPDDYSGYELGTWEVKHYRVFSKIIGRELGNVRPVGKCSFDVQICHRFTEEERQKIMQVLRKCRKRRYKSAGNIEGRHIYDGLRVTEEGFQLLKQLFSDSKDPPVYYFAD